MSMPAGAKLAVKNWREFRAELDKADDVRKKSAETAAKVEAYRLSRLMKSDIKSGQAGARRQAALRYISNSNPGRKRAPFNRLHLAVRYWVDGGKLIKGAATEKVISVGFFGYGSKYYDPSNSWLKIADIMQEGGSTSITSARRKMYARQAGKWEKNNKYSMMRKFYFLRKSTTAGVLPPRPVIDPFWRANKAEAQRNIMANFEKKMRGERI